MRSTFLFIASSTATFALAGCEKPVVNSARNQAIAAVISPPAVAAVAEGPVEVLDLKEDSAGDAIALITTKIDTTLTLGAWLRSHPADTVSTVALVGTPIHDLFCRAAVVKTRIGSHIFVRSALFYIPFPPKGEKLPTDTARIAEDNCDLRTIALASEQTDLPAAHALRDALAVLIDKRLGPHTEGLPLAAGGMRGASEGKMWRREGTSVVVGTESNYKPSSGGEESADTTPTKATTLVVAYAPGSGAADFDSWETRYEELHGLNAADRQALFRNVDSAVSWAAMPAIAADIKTVIAYLRARDENNPEQLRPRQVDVALLRALKAIHQGALSLPAPRRAAALLAGDVTLAATFATPGADSNNAIMRALPTLGLSFEQDPQGYGPYNPRAWLWEAYRLDSTGRAGRAAFVELLGMQWPDTRSCSGEEYKR
ncbi:MAG TPA: hypothetical protein VGN73_11960, partial [Gemmatimonadaceae bacterium]|nr:hypothetical protein [Gemmatimonadaceae bacterium]